MEPYATLGYLKIFCERDWPGADAAFRRAFELQPDYATAHHWYAFYLQTVGDIEGSLARIERASEIDPLSPVIKSGAVTSICTHGSTTARCGRRERS